MYFQMDLQGSLHGALSFGHSLLLSYLVLQQFVEDRKNVATEVHIVDDFCFHDGVAGTTAVLLDCSDLPKTCVITKIKKIVREIR